MVEFIEESFIGWESDGIIENPNVTRFAFFTERRWQYKRAGIEISIRRHERFLYIRVFIATSIEWRRKRKKERKKSCRRDDSISPPSPTRERLKLAA